MILNLTRRKNDAFLYQIFNGPAKVFILSFFTSHFSVGVYRREWGDRKEKPFDVVAYFYKEYKVTCQEELQ